MKSFNVIKVLRRLVNHYPDPKVLVNVALEGGVQAQKIISRVWLSEGIPAIFLKCPAVYDSLRCWLADTLNVHYKQIGLVGSAQLGKSMDPDKIGTPFIPDESDLDLFIISESLFNELKRDFNQWSLDFRNKEFDTSSRERRFWHINAKRSSNNIHRGFIDANTIPAFPKYPTAKKVETTMEILVRKLHNTHDAPKIRRASIRSYVSWDSFIQQKSLNLRVIAKKMNNREVVNKTV